MLFHLDALNLVIFASFVVTLFFAAQLLFQKTGNFKAHAAMVVLLISIMASISLYGLFINTALYKAIPHIIKLPTLLFYVFGPLLLFYVQLLVYDKRLSFPGLLLHFLPFSLCFAFLAPFFFSSASEKITFMERWIGGSPAPHEIASELFTLGCGIIHVLAYLAVVLRYLANLEMRQKSVFSEKKINLSWIKQFIRFGFISFLVFLAVIVLMLALNIRFALLYRLPPLVVAVGLITLSFRALRQTDIQPNIALQLEAQPAPPASIDGQEARKIADKAASYMNAEKPYLDAELTLQKLADMVGVTRNELSYSLNACFKQNFYDFVNSYRVEETKRIMDDSRSDPFSILQIGMDAGFNSKTAFNVNFKKATGMTPTEYYRKDMRGKGHDPKLRDIE
jgi:AraC-like DNA-binding protein